MRNSLLLLLLAACNILLANKIESVQSGNWNNPNTWKNATIPQRTDSIIIGLNHEVTVNRDSIEVCYLETKGNIKFANAFSLKVKTFVCSAKSQISSNFFSGSLCIDSMMSINNQLTINNVNIQSKGHCFISGECILNSESNLKEFENITITSTGKWQNNNNGDPVISGNIENNGIFISCKNTGCTYHFMNDTKFTGTSPIAITRIEAPSNSKLTNYGNLKILISLEGNPTIDNKNILELCTSEFAFHSGQFITSEPHNTVIYADTNEQNIYQPSNGKYENLILKNGRKNLTSNLDVNQHLELLDSAILVQHTHQINGNNNAQLIIDSTSTLAIGNNDNISSAGFPINFKTLKLHQFSTVLYQSKENQLINSEISYGNLSIDDGAVNESIKTIEHDSLRVRGNLWIAESSVKLKCANCDIQCNGDWNGIGNLDMQKGIFQLKGNGNNYGLLFPGEGQVIYNGTQNQFIKIGMYNKLIINKNTGKALVRGNSNILQCKTLYNQKSTLEIGNETVYITDSLINKDKIHFTSTLQSRKVNHLLNLNGGELLFKVATALSVNGNWINQGNFICNSCKIIFSDSTKNQVIEGNNTFNKIDINKSSATIKLNSNTKVQGDITFIGGKLNISNKQLILLNNGKIINENKSHYIYGNGGEILVTKTIIGGVSDTVNGIGLIIHPSLNWGQCNFVRKHTAVVIEGKSTINRIYEIHPLVNENLNESVIFNYLPHELGSNDNRNLALYKSEDEVNWHKINGEKDTIAYSFRVDNIHSFSSWTFKNIPEDPLPVQWLDVKINDDHFVEWSTASEINTNYFEVQISQDGITYYTLGSVKACGNCNNTNFYLFPIDQNFASYYRIKSVDFDGESSFSEIAVNEINNDALAVRIENNQLYLINGEQTQKIQLFSSEGKLILEKSLLRNEQTIIDLPSGIYIYRCNKLSKKLIVLN